VSVAITGGPQDLPLLPSEEATAAWNPADLFPNEDRDWSEQSGKRFEELARKEALGAITSAEMLELDGLSALRRQSRQARTGEELIDAYLRQQHLSKMVEALKRYVEFEQRPRPAT